MFAPGELGTPAIPDGYVKWTTPTYQSPAGNLQVLFYYDSTAGTPYYNLDYKAVFNNGIQSYK
jgi:hypothetical protein